MRLAAAVGIVGLGAGILAAPTAGWSVPPPSPAAADPRWAVCALIGSAAADHALPVGFLTRLIARESRFRANAVSPKGARGIAQFMPATAAARGLDDPFDPAQAIPAAAAFLAELHAAFGNLGLAAAAYNGGPTRLSNWLSGDGGLPAETRLYVRAITGKPVEDWAAGRGGRAVVEIAAAPGALPPPPAWAARLPGPPRIDLAVARPTPPAVSPIGECLALARLLVTVGDGAGLAMGYAEEGVWAPWGVQLSGGFSRALALSTYARAQARHPDLLAERRPMVVTARMGGRGTRAYYRIRVPHETRREANAHCAALRAAGQACIVLKSP